MAKTKKHEKKSKKKRKDHEHSRVSKKNKKSKKSSKKNKEKLEKGQVETEQVLGPEPEFAIPLELMNKSHAPETPEEYEKRQSRIRREKDPITGRVRLIKGDSEVLEEIVSKAQHDTINKLATRGDGTFYEETALKSAANRKKYH